MGVPRLSLFLFVPGIGADDPHHALAPDDLAVPADLLHGGFDFHRPVLLPAFFIVI
jgi:hypothetical protein